MNIKGFILARTVIRDFNSLIMLFHPPHTKDRLLLKLSSDIELVYKDMSDKYKFLLPSDLYFNIHNLIVSGLYVFSVPDVETLTKRELNKFIRDRIRDCPDFMFSLTLTANDELFNVIIPKPADVLVYRGLSVMLLRLTGGSLAKDGYLLESKHDTMCSRMNEHDNVKRIYIIDLYPTVGEISKTTILNKVKEYVGEISVYRYISSFLSICIYDTNIRNNLSITQLSHIPSINQLFKVLINLVLKDIIDKPFKHKYPCLTFYRNYDKVFLFTKEDDEIKIEVILEELGLKGKISSIEPGDDPFFLGNDKILCLDIECNVVVCNKYEYL